ncbi:MAG: hypothetical protein V3U60_11030 [Gammaproteobacteria bacterium]
MPTPFKDEAAEILRFGGGRNSRASEDQIHPLECAEGENFILDPGNGEFRPRKPFDLAGTAPNGSEIRGLVTLRKTDGTVSMLVQAGAQVYEWDGTDFTLKGTVAQNAKLRGPANAFWALTDKVLISDINAVEEIHEWDGTTFQQTSFFTTDGSTPFGSFRAKYILVENERTFYGNIFESGSAFEHLLVCSKRGDYSIVSADDRPADALGADAPWFLPTPQLKAINGMAFSFGILAISQEAGAFEKLTGTSAKNFALAKLHDGSGALGSEAVVSTSNDIIYGAESHIESLRSTDKFGDVEFDDLSFKIADDIAAFNDWTLVYNPRVRRIYCFPQDGSQVHVMHTDFVGTELSPWSKWTTQHVFAFNPTAVMVCRDPVDGLEYTFMGDSFGNLYKAEGSGTAGDAGTDDIIAFRDSKLYQAPLDTEAFRIMGWLTHRKNLANTAALKFLFSGKHIFDTAKDITLTGLDFTTVYSGDHHYGGNYYYGAKHKNRLKRTTFETSGQSNSFQIETKIDSSSDFAIQEIGLRFDAA